MSNVISKVCTGTVENLGKGFGKVSKDGAAKITKSVTNKTAVGKDCSKNFSRVAIPSNPTRTALCKANNMLRSGVKLNNIELPADTFMRYIPEGQRKAVASLLGNPETVICSAKANTKGSGFSILGFIGKKGDKTVGKGAVSVSQLGTPNAVAKWKFGGKNIQTNGFIDCAQNATPEQVSIIPSFVKKMLGIDVQAGNAVRANVNINAKKAVDLLPEGRLEDMAHKQTVGVTQTAIDKLMNMARKIIA